MNTALEIPSQDRDVLRRLADRKLAIAEDPVNTERRAAWLALDAGSDDRVMVLAEHCGIRDQRRPCSPDALQCSSDWARGVEAALRREILQFEELKDDRVVEPFINNWWRVKVSHFGVEPVVHQGGDETHMGSRSWDPPIKDLDADFDLLTPRTFTVDRETTALHTQRLESVFGETLPVRMRGGHYWTMGLTIQAIDLIGLESLMLSMYDNPDGLHRLMTFLRDDNLAFSSWLEAEGLYSLNNENDDIGSGSIGYTRDLPQAGWDKASGTVREKDLWVLLESQETVGVSPDLFAEFVFPYQLDIANHFGKVYYGCCEPLNSRWHVIRRIPNLARASVSPWADEEALADMLGRDIVFSRKPNPSLISTGLFDEEAIRADLRHTLEVTRGNRVEIIMKDVHTLNNEPERLARWVRIAREEIAKQGRD